MGVLRILAVKIGSGVFVNFLFMGTLIASSLARASLLRGLRAEHPAGPRGRPRGEAPLKLKAL